MSEIGIGFIGCGGIHRSHVPHFIEHPDTTVVCAMDTSQEALRAHQETYGTQCLTTNLQELLERDDVKAVVIGTPTGTHADLTVAAAEAGKHVLCEKPMALTVADCERMAQACAANGVVLQIAFVRHYCNEWLKMREVVQSGMIGRPVVWRSVAANSGPTAPWFMDRQMGGGPFIDGAVHNYDWARFMFGDAISVCADLRKLNEGTTAWDTGTGIVDFASGDQLIMCWSWGLPSSGSPLRAGSAHDLLGPLGAIMFPGGNQLSVRLEDGEHLVEFEADSQTDWFRRQAAHFVECIQTGEQPMVGAREGIEATRIAEAILNIGDRPGVTRL